VAGLKQRLRRVEPDEVDAARVERIRRRAEMLPVKPFGRGVPPHVMVSLHAPDPAARRGRHRLLVQVVFVRQAGVGDIAAVQDEVGREPGDGGVHPAQPRRGNGTRHADVRIGNHGEPQRPGESRGHHHPTLSKVRSVTEAAVRGLHRDIICTQRCVQRAAGRGSHDVVPAGEETMPPTKKNKKSNRRGTAAARTARARARHDGNQAAAAGVPPGLLSARNALPDLMPAKNLPPGLPLEAGEYAKLVPAMGGPAGLARARDKTAGEEGAGPETPPAGTSDGLPAWAAKAIEELLTVTYWLDPGEDGDPFSATIRFSGRRAEVAGKPEPGDTFSQEETVEGIVPEAGRWRSPRKSAASARASGP